MAGQQMPDIKAIMQSKKFKDTLSSLGGSFGMDSDELQDTISSPGFADELSSMANNLDIDSLLETAGGILPKGLVDDDMLNTVKKGLTEVKGSVTDLLNKPNDVEVTITITQEQAYTGYRKHLNVKRLKYESSKQAMIQEKQKLVLNIPAGITEEGFTMKVDGMGDEYFIKKELKQSDLIVKIYVEPNKEYKVVGRNFIYNLHVSLIDFLEDKAYNITFIDGEKIVLKKPKTFRLRNRIVGIVEGLGMPAPPKEVMNSESSEEESSFGDMIVLFNIKWKGGGKLEENVKKLEKQENGGEIVNVSLGENEYEIKEYEIQGVLPEMF